MIHLYNKYGTKLWVIRTFNKKTYLFKIGFWPSLKLAFAYELLGSKGFYKKTAALTLDECKSKFRPFYELSTGIKITILRSTWNSTKVIFEGKAFYIKAFSGEKLYHLEDFLRHIQFNNVEIKEN